jgi:APA family basic amino acid/polyamine antiporter
VSEPTAGATASADSRLVRAIGAWGLTAGIVNVTIGGGIFRLPAGDVATLGAAAPLAYLACTIAMALIVICFAEAGSRVSMTGGPYAYVETAFGPFVGFLAGVMIWVSSTLALSAVSTFFADSLVALVPALGATGRRVLLLVVLVVLAGANARGVGGVTRFNALATVAKLLPLLLLVVVGFFSMNPDNLQYTPPSAAAVSRSSVLLIFAFLGVEAALMPSGEIRDPARTVPRAIFTAMAVVAVLYVLIQIVAQGVLGSALAGDPTPLASAAGIVFGPWGRTMILVGSSLSMFAYVSGMTLALPRMLFAFGRDGFLPAKLASVHASWRTPHVAIVAQTVVVAALALLGDFEKLAVAANITGLLVYGACCLAAAELRRRDVRTGGGIPFRVPGGAVAPWLALVVIAWLLSEITAAEWRAAALVLAASIVIYVATRASRRARAVQPA